MTEQINLENIDDRSKIVDTLMIDIDEWSEREFNDGHRTHLGASQIGKPCSRELWYIFRWAKKSDFGATTNRSAGQTLRLLQRGHREEYNIIEYLEGIGCNFDFALDKQARISDIGGHFGGSLDGIGTLPTRYGIAEKILFEFKTANQNSFNAMKRQGVKLSKPVHWSQMCVYGLRRELRYALYLVVHKDTDELYMDLLELDWEHGKSMIDKAGMVITSPLPLARIAENHTSFECQFCNFKQICHHGEAMEKNCRTCVNVEPANDAKWICKIAAQEIPENVIPVGCPSYDQIK